MSSEDEAPKGFFSLPRELRDKIYEMIHTLREEVEFGIIQQLTVRFPLPRLHHISRRFRDECDSRMPSDTAIEIFQSNEYFLAHREQLDLPKIVHLRSMQTHQIIGKLDIRLDVCDDDMDFDEVPDELNRRLLWMESFVANACTNVDDVYATLSFNQAKHIAYAVSNLEDMGTCYFAGQAQLVFQATSGRFHDNLAVWDRSTKSWDVNYSGIAKCEKTVGIARCREDDE